MTHELADTMEKCDDVSAVLGVDVCKNLFLCNRQKTNFYLLCMPPHKAFHTKDLSHQIGSPVVRAGRAALGLAALHAGFSDDPRPDER